MAGGALVIGGTGPTGPHLVNGLRARGYATAILHRGTHESDEIPADVEHIHADPYDGAALSAALAQRRFDVVVATYGRLREGARVCVGRTGKFVGVGGVPLYRLSRPPSSRRWVSRVGGAYRAADPDPARR